MPITSEQIDELIRQMKIANQIMLMTLIKDFKVNPVECRTEKDAEHWCQALDEVTELEKYLDI